MFNCFKQFKNTVVPEETYTENIDLPKLSTLSKTAVMIIPGMGSENEEHKYEYKANDDHIIYYKFPYNTGGFWYDYQELKKDAQTLSELKKKVRKERSKVRLALLTKMMKDFVSLASIDKVYIIGLSHGSLLVHAAFLKLQMDTGMTIEHIKKIRIYTVGSPRYLPVNLLSYTGDAKRILNFYHIKDPYIKILSTLGGSSFKVPKIPEDILKTTCNEPKHWYNNIKSIVLVSNCKYPDNKMTFNDKVPKFVPAKKPITRQEYFEGLYNQLFEYYKYLKKIIECNYYSFDTIDNLKKQIRFFMFDFEVYHVTPTILYPVMSLPFILYIIHQGYLNDKTLSYKYLSYYLSNKEAIDAIIDNEKHKDYKQIVGVYIDIGDNYTTISRKGNDTNNNADKLLKFFNILTHKEIHFTAKIKINGIRAD